VWDEYYPNGSFSVPFTILAFHEQDLVCQAFQSDEEDWMNGGEQQSPAFATAFSPNDRDSIVAGFEDLRHFLRMMEALANCWRSCPAAICWRSKNEVRRSFRRCRAVQLKAAILLYGGAKRITFASVHEPCRDPQGGAPYLDAGRPISMELLRTLARGLGLGMAPEILPETVVMRTPEVTAWWVPATVRPMFFSGRRTAKR